MQQTSRFNDPKSPSTGILSSKSSSKKNSLYKLENRRLKSELKAIKKENL